MNDQCTDTSDPTECITQWAGLTKAGGKGVTIPAGSAVWIYVSSYYGVGSGAADTGDYVLSVRTEALN